MFKRKRKNSGKMSYDVEKYNEARSVWNSQQPVIDKTNLPTCIISGDHALYLSWQWEFGAVYLQATTKQGTDRIKFGVRLDSLLTTLLYELDNIPVAKGIILEGMGYYFSTEFVQKAVRITPDNEFYLFEWEDYTVKPTSVVAQYYSKEDVKLLVDSLHEFYIKYKEWTEKKKDWLLYEPKTWQYPLTFEEDVNEIY